MTTTRFAGACAAWGVLTWVMYGAFEYASLTLVPLARWDYLTLPPEHWRWTAMLLAAYAITGAAAGLLAAWPALRWGRAAEIPGAVPLHAATLTLAVSSAIACLTAGHRIGVVALSGGVPVLLAALISLRRATAPNWIRVAGSPWVGAFLLVIPVRIAGFLADTDLGQGAAVVVMVALVCAAAGWLARGPLGVRTGLVPPAVALLAVCAAMGIGTLWLDHGLPSGRFPEKPAALAAGRPNVVLVVLDTVRADHLPIYGYARNTAPNLLRFAAEAAVYRRAFSAGDMTLPGHGSMFTGQYASWHGAHLSPAPKASGWRLRESSLTLAEILAGQGYRTMAVVANAGYMWPSFGLHQGFQLYDNRTTLLVYGLPYHLRRAMRWLVNGFVEQAEMERTARRADQITRDSIHVVEQAVASGRPFFLFVNYIDTHLPYLPPPPFDRQFPGKSARLHNSDLLALRRTVLEKKRLPTDEEKQHMISQYDGAIAYVDAELNRLLTRLKQLGVHENTLIIITSDHGQAFGDNYLIDHGVSVYQDQVHVPLLIKYPGREPARVVDALASGVDLLPTVMDAAGLPAPPGIHGKNLRTIAKDEPRMVFSESFHDNLLAGWHPRFKRIERAMWLGSMKFIHSTSGKREMYDLSKDPAERHNLYRPGEPVSVKLEALLTAWIRSAGQREQAPVKLSPETIEQLRSLGYVQ